MRQETTLLERAYSPRVDDGKVTFVTSLLKDVPMQKLLQTVVSSEPERWDYIRRIFKGRQDVTLTVLDRFVNTPFRCQLLASFIKQLQTDLQFSYNRITVMLTPLRDRDNIIPSNVGNDSPIRCGCTMEPNEVFVNTEYRNMYMHACARWELEKDIHLKVRSNPVYIRDLVLTTHDHTLLIHTPSSITYGFEGRSQTMPLLPPSLHPDDREEMICANLHKGGRDKCGVWFTVSLSPNKDK